MKENMVPGGLGQREKKKNIKKTKKKKCQKKPKKNKMPLW
jgi:hypothetical protein